LRTRRLTAAIVVAILLALPAVASAKCKTLKCKIPTAEGRFVGGPGALDKQRKAGFYAYTDRGVDRLAYVIPPGQRDQIPSQVEQLPVVEAADEFPEEFTAGAITVFGPGVSMYTPAALTGSSARKRARAAALPPDSFNCYDMYFCIYEDYDWRGRRLQFHDMGYWMNLSSWDFNDRADSMRNRRDRDSWLAEHANGGGDRHCYDSHSSDSSFGGLGYWTFGDDASSVYNSTGDNRC
jgi:Peptidase inhibitor family I36